MSRPHDPIEEPTLRDMLIQHAGMNRNYSVDDIVRGTTSWQDWLALSNGLDDGKLLMVARVCYTSLGFLVASGKFKTWEAAQASTSFEYEDVYRIPGINEPEKLEALRTRRTEGLLRDLIVDDVRSMRDYIVPLRHLPECAKARALFDTDESHSRNIAHLAADDASVENISKLSDRNLLDVWEHDCIRLMGYAMIVPLPDALRIAPSDMLDAVAATPVAP